MAKRVWRLVAGSVGFVVFAATFFNSVALYQPDSAFGTMRFRWEYEHSRDKGAYLDEFRNRIWEHGGGYVPPKVAQFLCVRLESSSDGDEAAAITRFYVRQAGGREPAALFELSEQARRRVARTVLRDWRSYPGQDAQSGFVLLEGLRQNTYLGKANVILPGNGWTDLPEKLAPVASLFEKWNLKYDSVPFTKRPAPLRGTPYSIEAP